MLFRRGDNIGGYIVQSPLGEGGFGEVYLVRPQLIQKPFALKIIKPDVLRLKPDIQERFKHEMQILSSLKHPKIVQITDARTYKYGEQTLPFFVMEYLPVCLGDLIGEVSEMRRNSLSIWKKEGSSLPLDKVMWIAEQLCDVLEYVHGEGIVHMDLTPWNVLFEDEESLSLKLSDFGIARAAEDHFSTFASLGVYGTPYYIAPEVMLGGEVDGRADVFSMGVLLYRMLTGMLPAGVAVSPEEVVRGIPRHVSDGVMRAMVNDVGRRLRGVGELRRLLFPPPVKATNGKDSGSNYYMNWLSRYGGSSLVEKAKINLEGGLDAKGDMIKLKEVRKVIVHNSGFAAGNADTLRWYHRVVNKWPDIGYHFVIGNGKGGYSVEGGIETGRDVRLQGAHTQGHNHDSISVCLIGSFKTRPPSQLMAHALDNLLFYLCLEYDLDERDIYGHRDFNPRKSCPGSKVDMETLRLRLKRRLTSVAPGLKRAIHITHNIRWVLQDRKIKKAELSAIMDHWRDIGITRLVIPAHWNVKETRELDALAGIVERAKEKGFPVLMYTGPFGAELPSSLSKEPLFSKWLQRDKDGNPVKLFGKLLMFCPNSPYLEEYRTPLTLQALEYCKFDGVFLDIPWFLRKACYCSWCAEARPSFDDENSFRMWSVRKALSRLCLTLRQQIPWVWLASNVGAPKTSYEQPYTGATPQALSGLFDELVTELNPYRAGVQISEIRKSINATRQLAPGTRISHATTLTPRGKDECYPIGKLRSLFDEIRKANAGIWFSTPIVPGQDEEVAAILRQFGDAD